MKNLFNHIRLSLSIKLSLDILLFVVTAFMLALGSLFLQSRKIVRQEVMEHAEQAQSNTALCIANYLNEVETATNNTAWLVLNYLQPDSLMAFTHRVVALNPNVKGCSITTEPYFFKALGRYFSVYSVRMGDTISTVREAPYEYFEKPWYKTPREQGKACWIDPYDDFNAGTLSSDEIIASYCVPIYDEDKTLIGVISTDISLPKLSQNVMTEKPYPDSYCIMLGKEGQYLIHPDTTRLITQTIFTGTDMEKQPEIIALGHEMITGKKGATKANIDGKTCMVFYQPLQQAGWSIALICPENDVFSAYNQLAYIVIPLLCIGLLLILFFCRSTVEHFIKPLNLLVSQSHHIANGHFDDPMPQSNRTDVVGKLQNSFAAMQQSLAKHISHLRNINAKNKQRNEELVLANRLVQEADQRKTAFIQDMSHQIRTPLNIIQGFAQVLHEDFDNITHVEIEGMASDMQQNAKALRRIVDMLIVTSNLKELPKLDCNDRVACNALAHEVMEAFYRQPPTNISMRIETKLPDTLCIQTNKSHLQQILTELLFNAKKFSANRVNGPVSDEQKIELVCLRLEANDAFVRFIVEDKGPGIAQADRERIFNQFTKLNDFSEGLGLGLHLSQQFARMLGGSLYLDATYTMGARFVVEVPR